MYNPKVSNPSLPNNITQMRSGGVQPPFIAGGNQTAFYLGFKGNAHTSEIPRTESYSTFEKIINKHKK